MLQPASSVSAVHWLLATFAGSTCARFLTDLLCKSSDATLLNLYAPVCLQPATPLRPAAMTPSLAAQPSPGWLAASAHPVVTLGLAVWLPHAQPLARTGWTAYVLRMVGAGHAAVWARLYVTVA